MRTAPLTVAAFLAAAASACFTEDPPPSVTTDPTTASTSGGMDDNTGTVCDQGSQGCACFPNGTCSPGLVCNQGVCISFDPDTGGTTSTSDTSMSTDTTHGDPDTSTSSGGTTEGMADESSSDTGAGPAHVLLTTASDFAVTEFTRLTDADVLCTKIGASVVPGPWVAVLRNTSTSFSDRITVSGPVANTIGEIVAEDEVDFFSGMLSAPPGYDENGIEINEQDLAWTGSEFDNCEQWTTDEVAVTGAVGLPSSTDLWLDTTVRLPCSASTHLYCISQ